MAPEVWIPISISAAMLLIALLTLTRNSNKDRERDAEQRASMTADVKYIRSSVDDIKIENRVIRQDIGDLKTRVAEVDASAKHAHKRLDEMQKG